LEVDGRERDSIDNVRTTLGDSKPIDFDLQAQKKKQEAMNQAAESGTLTKEQAREMSSEQKAALEKAMKDRSAAMAKNKALNDAFNQGMEALKSKQYDAAVQQFTKAGELDPNQFAVWAELAESYVSLSGTKTGPEHDDSLNKGLEAFQKALA